MKPTETAPVAESAESKPQDTEISSSAEQKAEQEDPSNDKTEKEEVESTNGSTGKPEEKTVVSQAKESSAANGETKSVESPAEFKVEAVEELKSSEATPKTAPGVEIKNSEVEVKPVSEKVEAMEDFSKSSEAAAKPLPADDEKIIVEKDEEPKPTPEVTGSDEAKKPEAPQKDAEETKGNSNSSADSSMETNTENPSSSEKPGSSSTTVVEHDLETQIGELKKKGVALYVGKDYCAAADTFGKILEVAAPLYGEMSEKLAETYYMYGTSMFEYGKDQNDVLGEKVKEKDVEDDEDDEEGEGEQMEIDEKEADPAEDAAEKRPSTPSGYGETKDPEDDGKEPVDETITGDDKEDDEDDAFRVAWEMLELAKATFQKADNKKRLADTLMKLGDVGIETGDANAIAEMVEGLKVRKELYPANHRIIPETHFKIGVAFAYFEKYDDAIQHFSDAKSCLEKRIEELSTSETKEDKDEVEEMKSILPEIQEKIQDTKESKLDKEKIKSTMGETSKEGTPATFPAPSEGAKPAANISHLVKRKRKVDEILPERAAKQSRQEGADNVASTEEEPKKETNEPQQEAAKVEASEPEKTQPDVNPIEKSEEIRETTSEEKPEEKSDEVKAVPQSEVEKAEEATAKTADTSEPEDVKQVEIEAKPDEPEKMEE